LKLRRRKNFLTFGLVSGLAMASAVSAETLRDALSAAYETNPNLTAARSGLKVTDETVPLAKAEGRPSAQIGASYSEFAIRAFSGNGSPNRQLVFGPEASIPIYNGGATRNAIRAAETRVGAGRANLRATESSIFSAVVATYMDVIRDESVVELNRAQVGVLQINLEATRDRFEIGDLTRTDVAQSEARLALAIGNMESARANLIRSKENYIQLVGHEPGELAAPPPLPNLPTTPETAVDVALAENPDLIAAKQQVIAAGFDRKVAGTSRLPRVSAFAQGNYANSIGSLGSAAPGGLLTEDTLSATVGVQATIPLYQGGRPSAQLRQSSARLSQAQELLIAAERDAIAQTRATYARWRAANAVIAASERAVSANELSLEGVRAENTVGNRTILDILNAEQELLNSKVQLVTARRNAYVAGFSLLAAMGKAEARDLGVENGSLYDPVAEYDQVEGYWKDWTNNWKDFSPGPDPAVVATRTIDSAPQKAEIEAIPERPGMTNKRKRR
jgi:outer membrane protein